MRSRDKSQNKSHSRLAAAAHTSSSHTTTPQQALTVPHSLQQLHACRLPSPVPWRTPPSPPHSTPPAPGESLCGHIGLADTVGCRLRAGCTCVRRVLLLQSSWLHAYPDLLCARSQAPALLGQLLAVCAGFACSAAWRAATVWLDAPCLAGGRWPEHAADHLPGLPQGRPVHVPRQDYKRLLGLGRVRP